MRHGALKGTRAHTHTRARARARAHARTTGAHSAIGATYCAAALARRNATGTRPSERCPLRGLTAQRRRNYPLDRFGPLLELGSVESSDRIRLVPVRDDRELQPRCNLVIHPDDGNLAHDALGLLVRQAAARAAISALRVRERAEVLYVPRVGEARLLDVQVTLKDDRTIAFSSATFENGLCRVAQRLLQRTALVGGARALNGRATATRRVTRESL